MSDRGLPHETKMMALCLFAVLCAGVGSCAYGTSGDSTVQKPQNMGIVSLNWKKKLYSNVPNFIVPEFYEAYDRFSPVETGGAAFDVDAGRLLVGAGVGGFYCIDARQGKTVWRFDLSDPAGSIPAYDSGRKRVYFGADDGYLYALHARSGRLLWKTDTGAEIRRRIWHKNDTLYVVTADNKVLAVDPEQGEIIWRHMRTPVSGFTSVGYSDLAFAGNAIVTGFSDGIVARLDAGTGAVEWEMDLSMDAVAEARAQDVVLADVDATPLIFDDVVVAASSAGGAYGLDMKTGNIRWSRPDVDQVTGAANYFGEAVLVRAGTLGMVTLDPDTGRTLQESLFGLGLKRDPVVHDDVLLISDSEAGLYFVAGGTGHVLKLIDTVGGFFASPTVVGNTMVLMGNWSTLFSFLIR